MGLYLSWYLLLVVVLFLVGNVNNVQPEVIIRESDSIFVSGGNVRSTLSSVSPLSQILLFLPDNVATLLWVHTVRMISITSMVMKKDAVRKRTFYMRKEAQRNETTCLRSRRKLWREVWFKEMSSENYMEHLN